MSDELFELPESWEWTTASNVCESVRDGTHDSPKYVDDGIPLVTSKNLRNGQIDFSTAKLITQEDHRQISVRSGVESGDILFAMIGTIGNPVVVDKDREFSIKNVGLFKKNSSAIDSHFLKHWLSSDSFYKMIERQDLIKGTTQKFLPLGTLRTLSLPLPPLNEQKRIVAKIEELRDRHQAAKQALEAVPKLCDRFRQSVLAAAFRGDLTADWREENPDVEPASEFLEFERDASGWVLMKAQDACLSVQSGSTPKGKPFTETGEIPFLKVYNIVDQEIDFDYRPQYVSREVHEKALKRSITLPGDVLMNIVGPPLGKVALVTEQFKEWNINQALVVFRPKPGLLSKYLYYFLREGEFVRDIIVETKGIVGQVNISLTQCRNCLIKVPSKEEQLEIVCRVEALLALADKLESATDFSFEQLNRLNKAILAKAFRGELVEQDPNDEPASVLLDRIRAEREQAEAKGKKTRGSKRKSSKGAEEQQTLCLD